MIFSRFCKTNARFAVREIHSQQKYMPERKGFALKYMYIKYLIQRFQYATFEYDIPDGVIKAKS